MAAPVSGIVTYSLKLSESSSAVPQSNASKVTVLPRPSAFSIGVDMLHIPRLRSLLFRRDSYNDRFARRILSAKELLEYRTLVNEVMKDPTGQTKQGATPVEEDRLIRWLGVRWAAKEACYKACSYYDPKPVWKGVTVMKEQTGKSNQAFELLFCCTFITTFTMHLPPHI
ncbi:hypothetical protein BJ508DRAFT_416270 [Ascobolus immersus RN42]|uniref:4'-phosphopantetheinyl transferase domain-containing protein n=1 Tax=Ascobolus immersus RN42 TaxID=1160509 RepID=A0A3N4I0E9_ASCIM|nr:hypothetical protein BJ508DRAFT_416270 [Ascobolus immersus RN42]